MVDNRAPGVSPPDFDDVPSYRKGAPSTDEMLGRLLAGHVRMERELAGLTDTVHTLTKTEERRAGASNVWRMLGAACASIALAVAGTALVYAQTASTDHVILGETRVELREHVAAEAVATRARDDREDRLIDALARSAQVTAEVKVAILAIDSRVARIERALDARRR